MPDIMDQADLGADPRLERLIAATSALMTELSLDGVLERVVQVAAEVIGSHYAAIGVLAPDGRLLESFTTYGISDEDRERIGPPPRGHGILGLVIRDPRPIRLPDLGKHPDSYGFPPHHPPMHSFLGVPIVGRRGAFGNLYLTEKIGATAFNEGDERMAVMLAGITAAAVENARLHEESARLLEEVQGLHRLRERFFAMVNHELRNALAAVFGWAEMLVRKKDPATVPRAAFEVLDSAEQAIGLINDLLDLSRLDEDRLKPVIRAVEQILVNLLGNAIHHTPDATTIRLALAAQGELVEYVVDDQGPGIQETEVERIFDIYVTKATGEHRGVGLGLPLSRRLARLLGGELRAVSRPSHGGRFVLQLPASPES
jgi:signal transduction histidine kinase